MNFSKYFTKDLVERGYKQGIVRLTTDSEFYEYSEPAADGEVGVVCAIGEYWFYFGGEEAETSTVAEYKKNFTEETIIENIYNTILTLAEDWDLSGDECLYYYTYLTEHSIPDQSAWLYDQDDLFFVCPKCGSFALNDVRGKPVESNYCPACGLRLSKWDGKTPWNKPMDNITIDGKEYNITRKAVWETRLFDKTPENWVAVYLTDPEDGALNIAWYYIDPKNSGATQPEDIDYEHPHDIQLVF